MNPFSSKFERSVLSVLIVLCIHSFAVATYNPNYFSTNVPVNVPFLSEQISTINILDNVPVTGLKVGFSIQTPEPVDDYNIRVRLYHNAHSVDLIQRWECSGTDFTNTVIYDAASTSLIGAFAPYTGEYYPSTLMASMVTGFTSGTWSLGVENVAPGTAVITAFSLELNGGGVILPVEMTSFRAAGANGRVDLMWRTESEVDNDHFNLYRSTVSSERGELVAQIRGHNNSATPSDYSYSDINLVNGVTYYYRIADVTIDGRETMSQFSTSAIPSPFATGEIPIKYMLSQNYPNPFNPTTTITYGIHKASLVNLSVYNMLGEKVATLVNANQTPNTYKVEFNGSNLPSGTYYYSLSTSGFTTSKKLVLMK